MKETTKWLLWAGLMAAIVAGQACLGGCQPAGNGARSDPTPVGAVSAIIRPATPPASTQRVRSRGFGLPGTTMPTTKPAADLSEVRYLRFSNEFNGSTVNWTPELVDRFGSKIVIVAGHGTYEAGKWCIQTDRGFPIPVEWVVASVNRDFPTHQIVLIVCNPLGWEFQTPVPAVWYAKTNVYIYPTRVISEQQKIERLIALLTDPAVGDASGFEFAK